MKKLDITKEFLELEYVTNNKTYEIIAKELGCLKATVIKYAKNYSIPSRPSGRHAVDITGQQFNKLTAKYKISTTNTKHQKWMCLCSCGAEVEVTYTALTKCNQKGCWNCRNLAISKSKRKGYEEISGEFWDRIRRSAKVRNLEFSINIEYIWSLFLQQNRKCKFSGVEIVFNPARTELKKATASLDRIDSSKGYIENNVQWVHKLVNSMKQDMLDSEFIEWCRLICKEQNI